MDTVVGKDEVEGLREDIQSLTKAVLTVATVLFAKANYDGCWGLSQAREDIETTHSLVKCK